MPDKKTSYKEVLKSFFLAVKRLSLYSAQHPLAKEMLNSLFAVFNTLLAGDREILFCLGVGTGEMIVNEEILDSDVPGAPEIYERFKTAKIEAVGFLRGLAIMELTDFMLALAACAGAKPYVLPELLKTGSEHIQIRKVRYEKLEDGQKVVSKDYAEANLFAEGNIKADPLRALQDLEADASGVCEAIIAGARESGDFEAVVKKFTVWLSTCLCPVVLEKKKDPAKFMDKVFSAFKKEALKENFTQAPETLEKCAGDLKAAMLEEVFRLAKTAPKKSVALAARILGDEEEAKSIEYKFLSRLTEAGVAQEEAGVFIAKIETELAKDEEVLVSKKKLAKLMKVSDRYQEELERRVKTTTEHLHRENRRLCAEKERTDGVMRHLADGLVVVDKAGKIVMMNPAAEKLLGRDLKDSLGQSLSGGLKGEHLLSVARDTSDNQGEGPITKEIELSSPEESTKRILRASSAVVESENGKTVGMVTVLSDITRQKEIDEMKTNFVSLVTHELRTPVVAIQKSLELLLSRAAGAVNEEQERFLSMSKFNLERLNRLINDLLDLSKLEAGKFKLKPAVFDLRQVLEEVRTTLLSWAKDKEIEIRLEVKDGLLTITADRDRITQVLVNLAGNALKFTPAKGEVIVSAQALDKKEGLCAGPCVEVGVADTGIGIDPKDFKRIFDKFEQVSLVSPQGAGGTGLGLPIAKEIIQLHGGSIWVESQKGKGSKFIFVIPVQGGQA